MKSAVLLLLDLKDKMIQQQKQIDDTKDYDTKRIRYMTANLT